MESKIKEVWNHIKNNSSKRIKLILIIGLFGILLLAFSDRFAAESEETPEGLTDTALSYVEYTQSLEERLTTLISAIEGVGECRVMITLENSKESVYATDGENKTDDTGVSQRDEYVIYDSESGETPVLLKEYYPKVQGVTVVCSGGDNVTVQETVIQTVTSLFNIASNRVSVSKIKEQR